MGIQESQWEKVIVILKKLDEAQCLEHVMLIGSWADYLYAVAGVLPDYESRIRTLDLDFLIQNIRKPQQPRNATNVFKELGFLVEQDRMTGVTKLIEPLSGFEVEFLVRQMGSGEQQYMKTNLGVTAQALRHFEVLTNNRMEVTYLGMTITVPLPEAFVKHNDLKYASNPLLRDRKAFEEDAFGKLWQADTCYLPHITEDGKKRRVYCMIIIDDHSRFIAGGGLFYNDNAANFQKVLKAAVPSVSSDMPRETYERAFKAMSKSTK